MGAEKLSIINMEFASGDETNAEFHAQCIMQAASSAEQRSVTAETTVDLGDAEDEDGNIVENKKVLSFPILWNEDGKSEITIYYMLDGHEVEHFHPKETWHSGTHLLNLYYPIIELEANQLHTFEVLISMKNGTAHIDDQDIMATITGQGLGVQERWDGRITADDTLQRICFAGMPTFTMRENLTVHFITPKESGVSDRLGSIALVGMSMYTLHDSIRLFTPIVHDVVETADRKKMRYDKQYVLDEDVFTLRKDYAISGGAESDLNRGRMTKLVISTDAFVELTALRVLPFETLPFINKNVLYTANLELTHYMEIADGMVKLKNNLTEIIYGKDMKIDKGRLAVFPLGIDNMETIEELEVTNG